MAAPRRRFGPLVYGATIGALLIAASQPYWGEVVGQWQVWGHARRLHDPTPGVRERAQLGLIQLGSTAGWWVRRALYDPDPAIRRSAVLALPATDADRPSEVLDLLLEALRDDESTVRQAAAAQMAGVKSWFPKVSPGAIERIIRALRVALADTDPLVQARAAPALAQLGPAASMAAADLIRVLQTHPDPAVRVDAAEALLRVVPVGSAGRPAAVAAVRTLRADPVLESLSYRLNWLLPPKEGDAP